MKPASGGHTELAQRLTTLTERVARVSATLAEAGRSLMERRALPPDDLVDEMAAVHSAFAELRDRVVAAAATLAAGPPPPITTLRELEVLVNVLVDEDTRRACRHVTEEGARRSEEKAPSVVEPPGKTERVAQPRGGDDARRRAQDEARRKAAEAEEAWRRAETQAKRRAEEEAQRRAAEEARRKAEDEARRKAAEAEDARRKAEDEARRKAVAAEEERRKAAAEAEARRKAEEEARRKAAAAEEERRKAAAEAEARRKAEDEARRKAVAAEEERRKAAAEAEAGRKAEEEEARRKAAAAEEERRKATAEAEARRKAEEEEARRKAAAAEEQRQAGEEARRRAEQEAAAAAQGEAEVAEPVAVAEDETADSGLETAQWWISASASWASMRSKKAGFAAAVSDVLTKYPYFLSVPIQTSADFDDGMLAYGYGILLEHIEQSVPGFVSDALARLPARAGASLGRRLYEYLAQALGTGYGDFIKAVMLAAVPRTPPWATGGIEDGDTTTTVFMRPSARIGDTHQKAERFTQAYQRFGEHHFTAAVAPLTTRFFRVEALDVKEARHLGLRISEKGVPSDQAWVVSIANRGGAPQAKRHIPQGTVINGIGRECTSVWVGLFNADPENEKRYDVALEVTRRQPGTAGFRKR